MASRDESQSRAFGQAAGPVPEQSGSDPEETIGPPALPRMALARECDGLADRFLELASRLQNAVRPLRAQRTLPHRLLLDDLAACRRDFFLLREQAGQLADRIGAPFPAPETIEDLHALAGLLDDLSDAESRHDWNEDLRNRALGVLDGIVELAHRSSLEFGPLRQCQSLALQWIATIFEAPGSDLPPVAARLAEGTHPFASLLTLVVRRETLDDQRWARHHLAVGSAFGTALAAAASRGLLLANLAESSDGLAPPAAGAEPRCVLSVPARTVPRFAIRSLGIAGPLAHRPFRLAFHPPAKEGRLEDEVPNRGFPRPRPPIFGLRRFSDSFRPLD